MGWELSCRPSSSADCIDSKFGGSAREHLLQLSALRAALFKKAFSGLFKQARWSRRCFWDIHTCWKRWKVEWDWMWNLFFSFLLWKPGPGSGEDISVVANSNQVSSRKPRGATGRWLKGWSSSPVRKGWESRGCSAWRRFQEDLRVDFQWRDLIKTEQERECLQGHGVIEKEGMALNWDRVDFY